MIHLVCPNPAVDRTILLETLNKSIPNRPLEVKDFAGGKSFNVAYALMKENDIEDVTIHTILGGQNGERVKYLATESGINLKSIAVDKNTRECNIIVDTKSKEIYPIYEKGFELTEDILDKFTKQLLESISSGDLVVFSGSLMTGMPSDYISEIQNKIADKTVKFFVDTSGEALDQFYNNGTPFVIKVNDEEYNELFGTDLSTTKEFLEHLAKEVRNDIPYIIVTLGSNGAVARINGETLQFNTIKINVKNPIASGDFFLGGLVRGYVKKYNITKSIKRSMAYSTSNCLYWYPNIELNEIDRFENAIQSYTK